MGVWSTKSELRRRLQAKDRQTYQRRLRQVSKVGERERERVHNLSVSQVCKKGEKGITASESMTDVNWKKRDQKNR